MSRELLDKILQGKFHDANSVYETEMAHKAMDKIESKRINFAFGKNGYETSMDGQGKTDETNKRIYRRLNV